MFRGPRATLVPRAEGEAATAAAAQQVEQDGLVTCSTQACQCEPCVGSRDEGAARAGPCECTAKRETGYMCNCCWQHYLEIVAEAEQMKADAEQAESKYWDKVTQLTPAHVERNRRIEQQQESMQQHQTAAMQAAAALPPAAAPAAEGSPAAEAAPASSGTQTPAQQTRTSGFRYPPFPQP